MVAVAVAADNNRRAVATIATDAGTWGNDGGGGGVSDEPDIVYQGTTAQSRKVSGSRIGRSYTDTAGQDLTATDRRHVVFKVNATNYNALQARTTPAMGVKIGSGSGAYYEYYIFGNDNYPALGGWQILAISPNVSGYRNATSGSPTLTSVLYYSLLAAFSSTSKSENLVIDAIDIGRGLKLTGGDGASTDGVFADFIASDPNTSANRWGYVTTGPLGKVMFVVGELSIGENTSETAVATVFQDATNQVLIWGNGLVETGFHRFRMNLGNATTDIDITGATFDSAGKDNNDGDRGYTTTEDSRLVVEATGTAGAANLIGCVIKNTAQITLTSAVTLDSCDAQTELLTQSAAEIFDSIIRTTSASGVATLQDPTFGTTTDLRNTEFIQEGAGHAIEIDTVGTYDLTGLLFTGYGADATNSAAIYVSAGSGTVTLNISGGDTPTVRTAGATVVINNTVTLQLDNVVVGSQCAIYALAGGPETVGTQLMNETAVSATVTEAYDFTSNQPVEIRVRKSSTAPKYRPYNAQGTITANGLQVTVSQQPDPVAT